MIKYKALGIGIVAPGLLATALWLTATLVPGKPLEYRSEIVIAVPIARSWILLQDLPQAQEYVPGIVRTELTTVTKAGPGTSRRVYSDENSYINETITVWREGEGFTLRLHGDDGLAPAPFSQATFSYQIEEQGPDNTLVQLRLRGTMRGGIVGEWAGRSLLSGAFQNRVDAVGRSLKKYYESLQG